MHIITFFSRTLIFTVLINLAAALSSPIYAANNYTNSAHGSSTAGVQRTASELSTYAVGNCAHCHEQHGSILGTEPDPVVDTAPSHFLLFTDTNPSSQTTNFCLECHQTGAGSRQTGGITNNDYSTTFGGQAAASTVSIKDAFNPSAGSAHDLTDVLAELTANFNPPFTSSDFNPCGGCHNPHLARKNNGTGSSYDPSKAAISRPGDRENLWGDDTSERMQAYAAGLSGIYRAPFYVGANPANVTTTHEPDGLNGSVAASSPNVIGANTPDYDSLCLDCHVRSVTGTNPSRTIPAIPWVAGDGRSQHGPDNAAGSSAGNRIAPYTDTGTSGGVEATGTNFILSCLDCHEPHGANQANGQKLLRTTVNGTPTAFTGPNAWLTFCTTCHVLNGSPGAGVPNHAAFGTTTSSCNNGSCHGHSGGSQNF